jgi:hypothetical protein
VPPPDRNFAQGTRRLFVACGILGIVLLVGLSVWPLLTRNPVGTPPGGVNPANSAGTVGSGAVPAQKAGESKVGKNDPAGQEDASGGRARAIKQSSGPLELDATQHRQLRDIISHQKSPPRMAQADFDLMIGVSVPRQARTEDLPPEVTQVMNGYWGDQYLLVQDKMVIVDQHSRRIVAIVPNVA